MKELEDLKIRLQERIRIYTGSPGVSATFIDLAHIAEDMLLILGRKSEIGFKRSEKDEK